MVHLVKRNSYLSCKQLAWAKNKIKSREVGTRFWCKANANHVWLLAFVDHHNKHWRSYPIFKNMFQNSLVYQNVAESINIDWDSYWLPSHQICFEVWLCKHTHTSLWPIVRTDTQILSHFQTHVSERSRVPKRGKVQYVSIRKKHMKKWLRFIYAAIRFALTM